MKPKTPTPGRLRKTDRRKREQAARESQPQPNRRWYHTAWPWVTATFVLAGWVLLNGVTALTNLEQLPTTARRSLDRYLSWYHNDAEWSGVWSTAAEGYVDFVQLSAVDVRIEMNVAQGRIDGTIASPSLCKFLPMFDFVLLEGNVRGKTIEAVAYDFIGGKRQNFFQVRMRLDGAETMIVEPIEGYVELLPNAAKIRRHPGEVAIDERALGKCPSYCSTERENFFRELPGRPKADGMRHPLR